MRTFWLIVGVVVLLAAAMAVVPMMRSKRVLAEAQVATQQKIAASEQAAVAAKKPETVAPVATPATPAPPPKTPDAPTKTPEASPVAESAKPVAVPAPAEPAPKPVATTPAKDAKSTDTPTNEELLSIVGGNGDPAASKADAPAAKEMPRLETLPNGTQKVDGKFIIKGAGTKADPYVVSWDHLVSIQESFDPSQKKDKIPSSISFMDGTYVKITGYICFPLYVPQPKELLVMMNQWDGCCIGVPPTAYDAIEVQLLTKVGEDDRYAVHGSVKGKFQVKPYVTGNWLVGLYLMTEAEFEPSQNAGN